MKPTRKDADHSSEPSRAVRTRRRNRSTINLRSRLAWIQLPPDSFQRGGDLALAGILFLSPLIMGGRQPLGKLVYLCFVALLTACYLAEQATHDRPTRWKKTGAEWLLLSGLVLVSLQLIHLPTQMLAHLSPFQAELLPAWSSQLGGALKQVSWDQVSLTPHETWLGMGVFVAHSMLFLVLVQRFHKLDKIQQWLQWTALAALGMAMLGLLQYVSGTERYAWMFEHESRPAHREVCGPFANSNHFTHCLALGIGPLIWWLQRFHRVVVTGPTGNTFRGQKSTNQAFATATIVALAVVALAGLLAKSRGGLLVMFLATLVSITLYVRLRLLTSKSWYALGAIAVLVLCGLTFYGYQAVQIELSSLASGSLDSIDQEGARRKIWQANLDAARHFTMLGSGIGSHLEIYPRFFPPFLNHSVHARRK